MARVSNQCFLLKERPQGAPDRNTFELVERALPEPREGEVLCRTIYLSLDPYMRGRISGAKSYAASVEPGQLMVGETVGQVIESRAAGFAKGDFVRGMGGWQTHFCLPGDGLRKVDPANAPISTALGVLGMPGMTAYVGMMAIIEPKEGETIVVPAASGAVGAVAGQMAKLRGCRVVGIAGGAEKCAHVENELGFDACLDRKADDLAGRLARACPDGVDGYVELVGGAVFDAVLPLFNQNARIPVIGMIAHYNATGLPEGPDRVPLLMRQILVRRLMLKGMLVYDYEHLRDAFERETGKWVREGQIRYREDIVEGIENAPDAFAGLLEGRNFGKLLVRMHPDPTL